MAGRALTVVLAPDAYQRLLARADREKRRPYAEAEWILEHVLADEPEPEPEPARRPRREPKP